jgi:molybdopterin converting factor small subunit
MARIVLPGSMRAAAGGRTEFEMDAPDVRALLAKLSAAFPKLKPLFDRGVSVSIDNHIYRDAELQPIGANSEVYILPRMQGG